MPRPADPFLSEGLRPSDSPTRALTRRFDGSLRSRGSLAAARSLRTPLHGLSLAASPARSESRGSLAAARSLRTPLHGLSLAASPARSDRVAHSLPLVRFGLPYTDSRSPLRRLASTSAEATVDLAEAPPARRRADRVAHSLPLVR